MGSSTDYNSQGYIPLTPGYTSSFSNAFKQLKVFWVSLLAIAGAYFIFSFLLGLPFYFLGWFNFDSFVSTKDFVIPDYFWWLFVYAFISAFIIGVLQYGYAYASMRAARGEKPLIANMFYPFTRFFSVIFSGILFTLIVGLGFMFFIIPGILCLCRLAFMPYLVVDQKLGVSQSISGSWNLTKGHFWQIFLIGLSIWAIGFAAFLSYFFIVLSNPANVVFYASGTASFIYDIVSEIITIPFGLYIMLVFGSLYHAMRLEKSGSKPPENLGNTPIMQA